MSPTPKDTESKHEFLSLPLCWWPSVCWFQPGTCRTVNSHPLSLLSSAHNLLQQKYVAVCLIVCACASVRNIAVIYKPQATQCELKVNEYTRVRGWRGDGYNVAKISESLFQLFHLCEVCFGIFDSNCVTPCLTIALLPQQACMPNCQLGLMTGIKYFWGSIVENVVWTHNKVKPLFETV